MFGQRFVRAWWKSGSRTQNSYERLRADARALMAYQRYPSYYATSLDLDQLSPVSAVAGKTRERKKHQAAQTHLRNHSSKPTL